MLARELWSGRVHPRFENRETWAPVRILFLRTYIYLGEVGSEADTAAKVYSLVSRGQGNEWATALDLW